MSRRRRVVVAPLRLRNAEHCHSDAGRFSDDNTLWKRLYDAAVLARLRMPMALAVCDFHRGAGATQRWVERI